MVKKRRTTSLYIRNIPTDVKALFKSWCAQRGRTMHDTIIKLMKDSLK